METQAEAPKFKVRALDSGEEKSIAEREAALIEKAEGTGEEKPATPVVTEVAKPQQKEIKDEDIIEYFKTKYQKEVTSVEDLFKDSQKAEVEQLPEDVVAYAKYKKETGRGFEDFIKLQKDPEAMSEESVLKEYLLASNEGLDAEDIESMINMEYSYDEDLDDEKEIAQKKLAKKKALSEAKNYINEQREKYKVPLESKGLPIPEAEVEEFKAYKERLQKAKSEQEIIQQQSQHFVKKTDELFSSEFKGFKFNVEGKDIVVPFGDPGELKTAQSDVRNFVSKYLDKETGLLSDPEGYHRALAAAMNPEKLAKYFYDLGKAEAIEATDKESKNINMTTRRNNQSVAGKGFQVRELPEKS